MGEEVVGSATADSPDARGAGAIRPRAHWRPWSGRPSGSRRWASWRARPAS